MEKRNNEGEERKEEEDLKWNEKDEKGSYKE